MAIVAFLGAVIVAVTAIENKRLNNFHKNIKEIGEEIRDRRNLEYSLTLPNSYVSSYRSLDRRIPSSLYSGRTGYGLIRRSRPYPLLPSYAVQMEPMIQYSQKDPLYDIHGDHLEEVLNKNEIQSKILSLGDQVSDNTYLTETGHVYGRPHGPVVLPYYEHPEPIIEIIIKESNESLPAAPVVTAPKKKEPIQVFYVKYQKDPNGGENDVIYDKPVPAITPPSNAENEQHVEYTTEIPLGLTLPPPPSTTLRAIIKPESGHYHSDSGIRITFGEEGSHDHHEHNSAEEESAPQAAVALPHSPAPKQQLQTAHTSHFQKRQQVLPRDAQPAQTTNFQSGAQQRIQVQGASFPQTHQQLPTQNSPNQAFRSNPTQFQRLPNAALFNAPQQSPQIHNTPPPPTVQSLPAISHPGQPVFRPQPTFQQRTPITNSGRNQFRQNSQQRPFHQGPQPQQFNQFNEHEYLQQNYHTITTDQLEPTRDQQLPSKQQTNFRDAPRNPIQPPFTITQEEYNKRYYEQLQYFKQQENRNRQRPLQTPAPQTVIGTKFQQPDPPKPQFTQNNQINLSTVKTNIPIKNQQFNQPQSSRTPNPPPKHQQLPQPVLSQPQFVTNQINTIPSHQQLLGPHLIPPGGEVIASVPKYEQHLLITPSPQPNIQQSQSQLQHTQVRVPALQHSQSQIQQSKIQVSTGQQNQVHISNAQPLPQPSPLIQQFHQNPVRQEQKNNAQSINNSPLITSDFISVFEQNQREILRLQEKLRKSEEEQQKLLALTQSQHRSTQSDNGRLNTQNQFTQQKHEQRFLINDARNVYSQGQNLQSKPYVAHNTNRPPLISSTNRPNSIEVTTSNGHVPSTSKTSAQSEAKKSEKNNTPVHFDLPDEVPDDLRQQLLESGILQNAQISVLDYDKVGDIPIESLPPEQLANFYGAGGGLQISGSTNVQTVVKPNGDQVMTEIDDEYDHEASSSETKKHYVDPYEKKKNVEMKVVHFDPNTAKGQQVADKYVQDGAKQVDPVALNDHKYNRYLPLKVSGAHFPLPDVPELAGRKVTSVVVLAPVNYDFSKSDKDNGRSERAAPSKSSEVNFVAGDALKRLVKTPTLENYKKWLAKEKSTSPDLQSVVLLVTSLKSGEAKKEIFMYDVATQGVSKLSGELSNAFVDVAETNAHSKDFDQIAVADSGTVESAIKVVEEKVQPQKSEPKENKYVNHKPVYSEVEPKKHILSEKKDVKPRIPDYGSKFVVEFSTTPQPEGSRQEESDVFYLEEDNKSVNHVSISSGYSRMKMGRAIGDEEE